MSLPTTSAVSEVLTMLLGKAVAVTEGPRTTEPPWHALCFCVTPEGDPVALIGADLPAVAGTGAALIGDDAATAERAIESGAVVPEVWDGFAEIGNVLTTVFVTDRVPRVLLHSATRLDADAWAELLGSDLPTAAMSLEIDTYPQGTLVICDLLDVPDDLLPSAIVGLRPTNASAPLEGDSWRPYRFGKRSGVSRELQRALQARTVELAGSMASACNGSMTRPIRQQVLQFLEKPWAEYCGNVVEPSLCVSFELPPMEGRFVLTWPVDMAMMLIDLMLGGSGTPLPAPRSPSALDLELLERLHRSVLSEIARFFQDYADTDVANVRVDLDLQLLQAANGPSHYLVMWMETEVAGCGYQTTLGLPVLAVQQLEDAITGAKDADKGGSPAVRQQLLTVPLELHARFRPISMAAEQVLDFHVGDIVMLQAGPAHDVELACSDVRVALARAVIYDNRLCVQVERSLLDDKDAFDVLGIDNEGVHARATAVQRERVLMASA